MNKKKIYIVSVVIIILIAISLGIYYFNKKSNTGLTDQQKIDFLNNQPKVDFSNQQKVDIVKTLSAPANSGASAGLSREQKLKIMQSGGQ